MNNSKFYNNKNCQYFPCHKNIKENEFNCMFCYCPLYALKDKCGGNFVYLDCGIKDCSNCKLPHLKNAHDFIMTKIDDIVEMGKK